MLYALLGSLLLGGLSLTWALWQKAKVETELAEIIGKFRMSNADNLKLLEHLSVFAKQLQSSKDQIETLEKERDNALSQIPDGHFGNLLRLRNVPKT